MKGFKEFPLRGNLVEIAVGLVIATSFATVVAAFTKLLLALIAKVLGANPNFDSFTPGGLPVGQFITACVAFLILAAVVYFGVIKPYTHLRERFSMTEEEEAVEESVILLREIRDSAARRPRLSALPHDEGAVLRRDEEVSKGGRSPSMVTGPLRAVRPQPRL